MKFGLYNAILHDRSLPEALKVVGGLGLSGIELNSGGFLPAFHIPTFDDILTSDTARDDFLGLFDPLRSDRHLLGDDLVLIAGDVDRHFLHHLPRH